MTILNDTRLADFQSNVKKLGVADGRGQNAKPRFAVAVVDASNEGLISTKEAEATWNIYEEAARSSKGDERSRISSADTRKVRISETKKLIGFGTLDKMVHHADSTKKETPSEVFARAVAVINSNKCDVDGSTYQLLVKFAGKQIGRPALAFNDDEILNCLRGEAKAAKDELARLNAIHKLMDRCHNGTKEDPTDSFPSEELAAAMTMIESRIQVLSLAALEAKVDAARKAVANKATAPAPGVPQQAA